ncbi:hypothetical protein LWP59_00750 [Amycolatopsis acidiphila]|uniref:Uncharacterized protein n=1 Tax=Amycolatopsis acidiphila TaxID=715473 RepID=A0A558AMR3_9PSEU|nr:hypothetical protein [Amycolatopsis acidiphila]TVT25521.1 hypothetical protein FNH06_01515 [Amycolatopsis acidiphila]UIJ60264.1 hypothetical protein LWP59_00750 [Amycolatopsis acidiphila]GHG60415.1 hypothetical protein GCM10017788_14140 [Amycolatopsis acidiphila]
MRPDPDDVAPDEPVTSRRPLVVAGVVGFLVGLLVMGLLWAGSGSGSGATEDARAACGALGRAGSLPSGYVSQAVLGPGVVQHITAARDLSAAAAAQNPAYQDLADHLDGVSRMVISLNFADPAGRRHLTLAQQLCTHV